MAIAIPIFNSQMEKARESTDAANARSAYAELMTLALNDDAVSADQSKGAYTIKATTGTDGKHVYTAEITCKQKQDGWQNTSIADIAGKTPPTGVGAGKKIVITYTQDTDTLAITAS